MRSDRATDLTRSRSRIAVMGICGALVILCSGLIYSQWQRHLQRGRGQAIFQGRTSVAGRLVHQEATLSALATRCTNCHERKAQASYASQLTRDWLTRDRSRRGAPASHYQAAELCGVLRSGIDPAQVVVPTIMPRYDISAQQCADLWAYLISR